MSASTFPFFRPLAWIVIGTLCGLVIPAGAQDGAAPNPTEEPEPVGGLGTERIYRGGFSGLAPEEAQEADRILTEGRSLENEGKLGSALRRYKHVYRRYPRSTAAPEAYYRTAQIYLKKNNPIRAFEAFDAIVRAYPNFGRFNELLAEQYKIAYDLVKGKKLRFLAIFGMPNRDRGMQFFERIIQNAPRSDYAPLALMNIIEAMLEKRYDVEAIAMLERLITNYPNSIVTPDAYLRMAATHEKLVDGPLYDQGSTRESIAHYQDFAILYPDNPNIGEAEAGLARMLEMQAQSRIKMADFYYFKRSRYQAARVFYNEAITIAPTSDAAELAQERLAQLEADEAKAIARREASSAKKDGVLDIFKRSPAGPTGAPGSVEPALGGSESSSGDGG